MGMKNDCSMWRHPLGVLFFYVGMVKKEGVRLWEALGGLRREVFYRGKLGCYTSGGGGVVLPGLRWPHFRG